jgi:hypothetical protein
MNASPRFTGEDARRACPVPDTGADGGALGAESRPRRAPSPGRFAAFLSRKRERGFL